MAGFAGFYGSRKRKRARAAPADGPSPRLEAVPTFPAPTPCGSLVSGLAPAVEATAEHQPAVLVIRARRARDLAPAPQPSSAA